MRGIAMMQYYFYPTDGFITLVLSGNDMARSICSEVKLSSARDVVKSAWIRMYALVTTMEDFDVMPKV